MYLLFKDIVGKLATDIKTHDSELRGQEEAGRTRQMSVLFTGSTDVKFVNALNKPPLKVFSRLALSLGHLFCTIIIIYKGGQVTKPIVRICYKLLHLIQGVKSIFDKVASWP